MLHSFLFPIFFIFNLFVINYEKVNFISVALILAFFFGAIAILLFCSKLMLKNIKKGELFLSILLLLFFSYGHINNFGVRQIYLLPLTLITIIAILIYLIKSNISLNQNTILRTFQNI